MNKVKAGVVGVGHMGQYHAVVYTELIDPNNLTLVDINEDRVKPISQRYGVPFHLDYRELFGKVDIVSIAVPTPLHYPIARDFLENGIHVLLEKPIARDIKEAEALFALAEKNKLTLHIGHVERFNGAIQELKKIVDNPYLIECRRLGPFAQRVQDDGVVLDLMIHDIDMVLNLVDSDVVEIHAMGATICSAKDDLANVQMLFKNGCIANIIASRVTQNKIRNLAISQKDSYIFLDYTDQDIHVHRCAASAHTLTKEELKYKQESFVERIFVHKENPLKSELKHFIDCSTNGASRKVSVDRELASLRHAIRIMELMKRHRAPS